MSANSFQEVTTLNNTVLVSLAIIKTNWERQRRDYLENFVPMLAESVRLLGKPFTISELQTAFRRDFGLLIPQNVITSLVRRLTKRQLVTAVDGELFRGNTDNLADDSFSEIQESVLEAHNIVIEDMLRYLESVHGETWDHKEAEGQLEAYLQDHRLVVQGVSASGTLLVTSAPPTSRSRYLVCSYIDHLYSADPEKYKYLDTVLKGHFLANAVFLPEPAEAQRKFRGTSVFFDTPFLLSALGWAGRTRAEPCRELLDLLYETGARLCCFTYTLSEIDRILDACAYRLSTGSTASPVAGNKTDEYFRSVGYSASDIELLRAQLEKRLLQLRVSVVSPPAHSPDNAPLDEEGLSEHLQSLVGYSNPRALQHDVDCLSAILRLRRGREYLRVEDCQAIFVTTNNTLATASMQYFYRTASITSISPIITDITLTNLLWLKKPFGAPDLPRKRLIADCFAACQPSDELWAQYVDEINHLKRIGEITAEDYYVLRHSSEARAEVMRLTQGDEDSFRREQVSEILESIREKQLRELREQLDQAETLRISAEEKAAASYSFELVVKQNIERIASFCGKLVYTLIFVLFVGILATGTFVGYMKWQAGSRFQSVIAFCSIFAAVVCLMSTVTGANVKSWARSIEVRVTRKNREWLLSQFTKKTGRD